MKISGVLTSNGENYLLDETWDYVQEPTYNDPSIKINYVHILRTTNPAEGRKLMQTFYYPLEEAIKIRDGLTEMIEKFKGDK